MQRRLDVSKRNESFLPAENPLLLSGLAFAGANRRVPAKADETDRILTAGEIAGISLQGVDWAVLSACDTGVGEVKAGEGVFGLRRAFQVAGAKTVIMSLWPVEDETARQWMEPLYREHFLNGKDTAESVRAASRQILKQRRAKTSKHTSSLLGSLTAVAQSGYPGPDREHDRGYTGQWQERISPDDQKEFKKEYGKWQEANAKNDRDDIDRHARKMEEIMARYHIPPDTATRVPI